MTMPARRWFSVFLMVALFGVLGSTSVQGAAMFEDDFMNNSGYIRQYVSMNLQDIPETLDDDQYALNMVRTQALLESDLELADWSNIHSRLRTAKEYETEYLDNLQNPNGPDGAPGTADDEMTPFATSPLFVPRNGARSDLADFYGSNLGENDLEIRELYLDLNLTRSVRLRMGKQLLSWGKGSFERALDLVSGFDQTWAPFITDEEERRKSLIMGVLDMDVPTLGGSIQAYYQPGYDDPEDIGTSLPAFGGRNTLNTARGINTHQPLVVPGVGSIVVTPPTNPNHPEADVEDEKFGLRFRGLAFNNSIEYSLAYLRTHQKESISHTVITPYQQDLIPTSDPRCDTVTPGGDLTDDVYSSVTTDCLPSGRRRETINPVIDVYGGSFNYYSPTLDVVTRGEVAYLKDRVFNQITQNSTIRTTLSGVSPRLLSIFTDSIVKDEYRLMLGFDRTAYFATWLGADRPGLLTIEFFDFLIDDFEDSEEIVDTSHSQGLKEHSVEAVFRLNWSYANGYYIAGIQSPIDLSYGGNYTIIPSFGVAPTTNWRVELTGVFVMEATDDGTQATTFGANGDADRLTTIVTYQF